MYVTALTFADLSTQPGFPTLLEEYGEECAIDSLPVNLDLDRIMSAYGALADAGMLHIFGAFVPPKPVLVGFLITLVGPLPSTTTPLRLQRVSLWPPLIGAPGLAYACYTPLRRAHGTPGQGVYWPALRSAGRSPKFCPALATP